MFNNKTMNINILIEKLENLTNKKVLLEDDEITYSKYIKPIKIDERIQKFIVSIDDNKKELMYTPVALDDVVSYIQKLYPKYKLIKQDFTDYMKPIIDKFITINGKELTIKTDINLGILGVLEKFYSKYIINVEGCVDLEDKILKKIPIQFGYVTSFFDISNNYVRSLKGCPKKIDGYFSCANNDLTSLEGCPEEVGGNFYCYSNNVVFQEKDIRKLCKTEDIKT